jgi:Tol biopolymer transport system component
MTLTPGTRLGPYKILAPLGAGGMGEVYRAHDTRLGRDVAIKVLSPHLAATPEVRARFEREARTISQLNHPHICTLHDIGHQDGTDYLVMELLEGETLARRLEKGPLPVAEVLTLGTQIADALDRAHRAGVVHRDLKPGNVMLTKSGAKLMDFGLARVASLAAAPGTLIESPTVSRPLTAEGTIVGTFQYMAPEQLEGKEADARSDLWALGCVLYEMATGKRAFEGASQASLIVAIMEHEPRPILELQPLSPPALERVVRQCLAKDPDKRWQSAGDLARELEWIATAGSQMSAAAVAADRSRPARRSYPARLIAGVAFTACVAAAFFVGRSTRRPPEPPTFTALTSQRGTIENARFAPDGRSVIYGAAWDGRPPEIFATRTDNTDTRSLGFSGAWLHAVSRSGELAVGRGIVRYGWVSGPLAAIPATGGSSRDLATDVSWADWSPDGSNLAVVRRVRGEDRLEMPPGRVLAATSGHLSDIRVSPDGRHIAFIEHSVAEDTRGCLAMVDLTGRKTTLTSEFIDVGGLAWSRDGSEIWLTASVGGTVGRSLLAVTLKGRLRTVGRFPTQVVVKDVAPDGRVLLACRKEQAGIRGKSFTDGRERELGWLDWPAAAALSADGKTLLIEDSGGSGGPTYTAYLRSMDGSAPVRLGRGAACALSPDGRWALAIQWGETHRLVQIPTGPGDTLCLPRGRVETYQVASWLPDGRRIVFVGAERGRPNRTWVQALPAGLPEPLTPEGTLGSVPSPDGRWVAAVAPDSTLVLCPLQGGEPKPVAKLAPQEGVCQWSTDGKTLFISRTGVHLDVLSLDVQTGARRLWKTFELPDPAGALMRYCRVTPDGRSYAYGYTRSLDELYVVEGLK